MVPLDAFKAYSDKMPQNGAANRRFLQTYIAAVQRLFVYCRNAVFRLKNAAFLRERAQQ